MNVVCSGAGAYYFKHSSVPVLLRVLTVTFNLCGFRVGVSLNNWPDDYQAFERDLILRFNSIAMSLPFERILPWILYVTH